MESEILTNEEKGIERGLKNDQQKLETESFLEKTQLNSTGSEDAGNEDGQGESREELVPKDDYKEARKKEPVKERDSREEVVDPSGPKIENKVFLEAVRLLSTPVLPEPEAVPVRQQEPGECPEMSRSATKPKAANKSTSRPSLSKVPGELTCQPSVKNTKDDVKYWKSREQELLDRIAALESKVSANETDKDKARGPPHSVAAQRRDKSEENHPAVAKEKENYKSKLQQMEREIFSQESEQSSKGTKTVDEIICHLKAQNEDLRGALAKTTAILRDKNALCMSQEKKVAALTNQVESLKEVVAITKDLLNIRNMEVQHISNDISAMESKIDCERQRHNQMLIKMDEAVKLNSELKKEYENQMKLFQHLRDNYEEKIRMISQTSRSEEDKEQGSEPQRNALGNGKAAQTGTKGTRASNFKVNFHDT